MSSIRVGLKEVVIAKQLTDVKGGASTWDAPIALACAATAALAPVGALDKFYGDDAICDLNETYVGEDADIQISDVSPETYALIMGHAYASGGVLKSSGDTSPYFAVGYKVKKSNGTYIYRWLFKVKFKKAPNNAETLKESTTFQPYTLTGAAIPLLSNGEIEYYMTNDDPAYSTTKWASFFTNVTTASSDTTALTATAAVGAGGDTGKVVITFVKGSAASFSLNTLTVVLASSIIITDTTGNRAGALAVSGAGTSVTVKFTPTVPFSGGADIGVSWNAIAKDNSNVSATPNGDVLTF